MSVVDLVPRLNGRSPGDPPQQEGAVSAEVGNGSSVVPLNLEALVFDALAATIEGSAWGWSDADLARLECELQARYAAQIGGRAAVRKLVRLARNPPPT